MASHYKLKATIDGSEVVGESLTLNGSKPFKVFPVEKNNTDIPIRGSAVVNILGKNHNIQLTHKAKSDSVDPDPSSTKWSYILDMYTGGSTPVSPSDKENQNIGYTMSSCGKTNYYPRTESDPPYIDFNTEQKIYLSKSYTTKGAARSVIQGGGGTSYNKGDVMPIFNFTMYYKYSIEVDGQIIPPTVPDPDTPESHRRKLPCRPQPSPSDSWVTNTSISFSIKTKQSYDSEWVVRKYDTFESFLSSWDLIKGNDEDYYDVDFFYTYNGVIQFNEATVERDCQITISEYEHGATPLYFIISQQEGEVSYGASAIPASADFLVISSGGNTSWRFNNPNFLEINNNKLNVDQGESGAYNFRPKFKVSLLNNKKALNIPAVTNSIITNQSDTGTVNYQYIGQPFILKLYRESPNGIEYMSMRPYYKQTPSSSLNSTEFWKDQINILGPQNFNPLLYTGITGDGVHTLNLRKSGYRGFVQPSFGDRPGTCVFQLLPLTLYLTRSSISDPWRGGIDDYSFANYVDRYNNYCSAIGSISYAQGDNAPDRLRGAFLKWPNEDGNNAPDHIPSIIQYPNQVKENKQSIFGKGWESTHQSEQDYKYIDRVLFIPVLWSQLRLEESSALRQYLSDNSLGYYMLSPMIPDSEIDVNPSIIYKINISGVDIELETE